jgi:hypothetical protein
MESVGLLIKTEIQSRYHDMAIDPWSVVSREPLNEAQMQALQAQEKQTGGFPRVTPQVQAVRDTERLAILERERAIQQAAGRVDPDLQAEIANARRQAGVPAPQPTVAPQGAAQPQSDGWNVVSRNPLTEEQAAKLFAATPVAPPKEAKSVSVTPGFAIIPPTLGRRQKPAEAATPAAEKKPEGTADKSKPLVYPNKTYALDDAVNWLEEGANQDKVINAFSKIGVTWDEIVRHGKERNSEYFKQQAVPPVPSDLLPFGKMREKRKASGEITSLEPKPEDQSVFRQVADLPLGYTQGVVQGIRMIADTMGAEKSKSLRAAEDYIGRLMSAQSRQDKEEQSKIMKEAEDKGVLDQLKAGLKALSVAPAQTLINAFGTSAPAIIAGAAATALGAPGAAVTGVLVGTGALMGAGSIKGAIYEVTKEELEKIGVRKEEAEKRATEAQKYGGKNLDQILLGTVLGAGASAIGMESGVAKALAANIIKKSAVKLNEQAEKQSIAQITKTLTAAGLKEGTPEFAQGFQEMVAKNVALQREGFNVPTYRGAVAAGTLEGLAGVGLGVSAKAAPMIYGATLTPEQKFARALQEDIDATRFTQEGIQREAREAARGITPETLAELAARRAIKPPPQKPKAEPAEGAAAPEGRVEPSMVAEPSVQEPAGRVEPIVGPAAPVEVGPRAVEAIPGMPTGEELAEPEVTPVTKVEAAKPAATPAPAPAEQPVITPITPAEAPAPAAAGEVDPLFNQAAAVVLKTRRPSISFIQRHLHIEYDRAARLIEQMEQNGLVSPINSMGNREVLVPDPTAVPAVDTSAPTAAKPEPSEAPAVKPTKAAESMPETPTVPPVTAPKIFEPPAPMHATKGLPTVEVPLAQLRLSKDVPQFKLDATAEGVVEALGGKFERVGVAPIQVWRRLDGSLEIISGRHRFDLAKRSGETTIPSQIHDEALGFDRTKAATLDAELNIRDGQGKVKDYVNYFKESGIDRKTAESRGLLARATGKRSFTIANQGSDELITAVRSDQIGDEAAYYIALNAPSDARLQGVGIKAIMDNKSMNTAVNMMQAVKALAGENETTTDMFGFDDSAIKEAEEMAKLASMAQREIQTRLSAITGAARNPAVAKAEGIDIKDPVAIKNRIEELKRAKAEWDNWSTNPELVSLIRKERGVAAPELKPIEKPEAGPGLELTAPTPQDLRAKDEDRERAEEKAIADREVDLFQLQPQVAEKEAPPQTDLFAGEAAPSAEYQVALEKSRRAGEAFRKVQEAYRKKEIGDDDFLAGRRVYDAAMEEYDRAYRKERGEPEPVAEEGAPTKEQVKNETKFLQDTTQNALEAIKQDFMVGDLVRFGNTSGVVIGLEGDYARFRPDAARSPKAYQRVTKKSLTFVSRPDTTSEVSYSKEQDNKFGDEAGQLNADKSNLIRLLGANMYQSSLSDVAIKELLQNAFDAVKGATASVNAEGKKIKPIYKTGNIEITIDRENRTISVKDDARGMTPDIVRKAFFTIAGSDKSDLPPELRSGGLGLAKMGFMLGSETLQLNTVRDGVRVTVDASAADIASDNFKINKAPAPKGEHGTTVTVKIPENYIDPKTGDPKPIYFPYSLKSVDAFKKPLVGPVELKVTLKSYGDEETSTLPVGVNFPEDKYTKFKANFDWGSADIYFSVDRNNGNFYEIKHQVLSSGVYQFSPDFQLNNEKIPYDIIVDVKPNVDARHPDYPFENSRERFKGRLEKDVEALTMYLGQIARGYEARDLQESFKGVVSMPRVEAGAEIAGMAEKLKKTFGTQAAAKPAELKPLPKEITVTADSVTDTKTQQILVDVKAKEAEKKKEATFKGEAAPKALDFMIELKQDPKLPVFHNNTNVDFLAIGRPYGEPEKFFAELGTLLVEMKEEMAKSGMYGYEKLAPENLFFAGVSIDKQYGGVHIKVPYKAVFINPFYSFGARTLFGVRQQLLNTMIHEIAHTGSMDHGVAHNTNMVKVEQHLSDEGLLDYYRDALLDILRRHESAFTAMREAYGQSTTRNTAKSLEDYGKDAAAASARGDRSGAEYAPSAVSARGRPERGEGVPEAEAAGREGAVGRGAGEPAVIEVDGVSRPTSQIILDNIEPMAEPSLAEQEGDLIFGGEEVRKSQIKEYAKLRREIATITKKVAAGEVSIDMQRNLTRMMQTSRELQTAIRNLKPRRDSAEVFLAKALTEYDKGNLEKDVLDVIQAAYLRTPELLDGLLLQVIKPTKRNIGVAGNFNPLRRAVTLYKNTRGVYDPVTIRHELTHSLEQMMTPEQRMAVVQAWGKALQRAIKQNPGELHQEYFNAILDFFDKPTEKQYRIAQSLLPSYDMYQFINPSEFWAVNAEKLMAAELGSAWAKFKRAVRKLLEGMKKVLGFDSKYDIHKVFNQVMGGSKERISDSMLVEMVKRTDGDFTLLNNIEENKQLVQKYNRPKTPMLDKSPIKTFITKQFQSGKEFVRDVATSPIETTKSAANSVIDGMIYLRNQNVWYGSGLEARDFDRYNGELRTSEGIVTASVALDNAIRSGNIGVEVIFKGGIEYNKKLGNYVAVERKLGMRGVYEAEAAMKKKLGDQLGTDIIQGYLEAKRSISIMNELYEREAAFEAAKTNHQAMKDMKADADQIAQAKSAEEELKKELEGIKKAASSVNMSEEERYEFAALDEKHPELRDMMENWNAINQNLLTFWRQVGLLSQGRYEALSAIKDYVPWYRIMNDELDLHDSDQSAVQSTTRSMTNIGVEKLFKRGRPISVVDFRAKEGQKDFKIQPSSVVTVEVNGKKVNQDLISVTPSGEVHVEMDLKENDLVVFKTNREIQNIVDNMTRNVMRMTMNGIRQFAANRIVLEYASRDAKNKIMVFPSVDKNKGRFNWVVNGKKVVVEIRDPLVAAAIYGMDNLNLRMLAPLAAVANFTRRTITLSGVFQIKQVFKDAPTAAIVTGVKNPMALIGGVWKGFLTSLTKTDPVVDILKSAGIGGFMSPARTPEADIKLRLGIMNGNVFSSIIKFLDHIGDSSDMAQRVATYKRVLAETGDETQALYQAANVINFLHHGASGYAQAAVKTVPFMGAYANSIDVLMRALMGGGLKGMSRKKALARLTVTASLLAGATLLYCMVAGADPDYDELDDQTKLKNIIIPGTKIILPMNTSAAYFFKAIPEMIYNKVTREGTENEYDRQRLRKALGNAAREMLLGPEPVPAGIKPVVEVGIKHSFFTGRPIVPEGLKDVAAAEQYTATTSELGKRLSAMMEIPGTDGKRVINPIEADHLVRGLFGTAGAMVQWISNSIGVMAESRPELMAREQPITGSFLRDEVPRGREDLFYDFKKEVFEKHKTWKKMVDREDFESADKYIEKHGDVASMYKYINKTEQRLKKINAEIRRLGETRSKDMTPKERREEIDELRKIKQELFEPVKEMRREVLNEKNAADSRQ